MPYGYTDYHLARNKSTSTVKFEVIVIRQFLKFVSDKYKTTLDPIQFTPKDVRDFLDHERKTCKDSTIYRKQSHIKRFFDYLWKSNYVAVDFMEKFDYFGKTNESTKYKFQPVEISFDYHKILDMKKSILQSDLPLHSKLLALLYTNGIQLIDIYRLQLENFQEIETGDISLSYVSKFNVETSIIFTDNDDKYVIRLLLNEAIKRGSEYLITRKSKKTGQYEKAEPIYSRFYIQKIAEFIKMPFRSDEIRVTYAAYLFHEKEKSIEEISRLIGRPPESVLYLIETSKNRMSQNKNKLYLDNLCE